MGSTAEAGILDDWLRRIGLICQVVGFLIAAAGVANLRRRHSDRPGIVATVRQGLDRARSGAVARARSLLAALRRYGQQAHSSVAPAGPSPTSFVAFSAERSSTTSRAWPRQR